MKLWEVLKALEENPKRRFESERGCWKLYANDGGYMFLERYMSGKMISSELGAGGFNGNFTTRCPINWQEVKQSVTWQEAIEAWLSGKTIQCVINCSQYMFDGNSEHLEDILGSASKKQFEEGTWYIEEETK